MTRHAPRRGKMSVACERRPETSQDELEACPQIASRSTSHASTDASSISLPRENSHIGPLPPPAPPESAESPLQPDCLPARKRPAGRPKATRQSSAEQKLQYDDSSKILPVPAHYTPNTVAQAASRRFLEKSKHEKANQNLSRAPFPGHPSAALLRKFFRAAIYRCLSKFCILEKSYKSFRMCRLQTPSAAPQLRNRCAVGVPIALSPSSSVSGI